MARQSEERLALDEAARLAPNGWSSVEIRLLECTARGFRAACDVNVKVGAQVTLEVEDLGSVTAYVTWRRGGLLAATFAEPIDLTPLRFMALNREAVLARLLTERAAAHAAGKGAKERELRGRILHGLPVRAA